MPRTSLFRRRGGLPNTHTNSTYAGKCLACKYVRCEGLEMRLVVEGRITPRRFSARALNMCALLDMFGCIMIKSEIEVSLDYTIYSLYQKQLPIKNRYVRTGIVVLENM